MFAANVRHFVHTQLVALTERRLQSLDLVVIDEPEVQSTHLAAFTQRVSAEASDRVGTGSTTYAR